MIYSMKKAFSRLEMCCSSYFSGTIFSFMKYSIFFASWVVSVKIFISPSLEARIWVLNPCVRRTVSRCPVFHDGF